MYAIITAGGKQHRVVEGETLSIDFIKNKKRGDSIVFDEVLMLKNDAGYKVGTPYVGGVSVQASVVNNGDGEGEGVKAKKVYVFRKRRRHNYKKLNGFRALSTQVKIDKITA